MTPERFRSLDGLAAGKVAPLQRELERLRRVADMAESSIRGFQRFQGVCQYLVNGVTPAGFFGLSPNYGMFVSRYQAEPYAAGMRLVEVDLVIIPDVLVAHKVALLENGSHDYRTLSVPEIIQQMNNYTHNAQNVLIGSFANVLYETCVECSEEAVVVAVDQYIDEGNGREFTAYRLCEHCMQVGTIATYTDMPKNDWEQYRLTDGIYRHE